MLVPRPCLLLVALVACLAGVCHAGAYFVCNGERNQRTIIQRKAMEAKALWVKIYDRAVVTYWFEMIDDKTHSDLKRHFCSFQENSRDINSLNEGTPASTGSGIGLDDKYYFFRSDFAIPWHIIDNVAEKFTCNEDGELFVSIEGYNRELVKGTRKDCFEELETMLRGIASREKIKEDARLYAPNGPGYNEAGNDFVARQKMEMCEYPGDLEAVDFVA